LLIFRNIKKSSYHSFDIQNKLYLDFIVNKYVDIEKRLALSEYKRNKDKRKIKRITNDLYETEEYEKQQSIEKQPIEKQTQPKQLIQITRILKVN
jgi:hypothetical protein